MDFTRLLEELVHSSDRSLSHSMETNAKLMYKKLVRTSTDPYKRYEMSFHLGFILKLSKLCFHLQGLLLRRGGLRRQ